MGTYECVAKKGGSSKKKETYTFTSLDAARRYMYACLQQRVWYEGIIKLNGKVKGTVKWMKRNNKTAIYWYVDGWNYWPLLPNGKPGREEPKEYIAVLYNDQGPYRTSLDAARKDAIGISKKHGNWESVFICSPGPGSPIAYIHYEDGEYIYCRYWESCVEKRVNPKNGKLMGDWFT